MTAPSEPTARVHALAGAPRGSAEIDRAYRESTKTEYERRFRHAAGGHRPEVVNVAVAEIRKAVDVGGAGAGAKTALDLGERLGLRGLR